MISEKKKFISKRKRYLFNPFGYACASSTKTNLVKSDDVRLDGLNRHNQFFLPVTIKNNHKTYGDYAFQSAGRVLKKIDWMGSKNSISSLIKKKVLFGINYPLIHDSKFHLIEFMTSYVSPNNGCIPQSDGIFSSK